MPRSRPAVESPARISHGSQWLLPFRLTYTPLVGAAITYDHGVPGIAVLT